MKKRIINLMKLYNKRHDCDICVEFYSDCSGRVAGYTNAIYDFEFDNELELIENLKNK